MQEKDGSCSTGGKIEFILVAVKNGGYIMLSFQKSIHKRLLFTSIFIVIVSFLCISSYFVIHSSKPMMVAYPEDFLTMRCEDPLNNDAKYAPLVYASGQNSNGPFRIVYHHDYDTFEQQDPSGNWGVVQTVYKDANYVTSEGIAVGSSKKAVIAAYSKYGFQEYNIRQIATMNVRSLDMLIKGVDLANTFLYVDNHNIFSDSYPGTDYWGGLGAFIFIIDQNNTVEKILSFAPTAG